MKNNKGITLIALIITIIIMLILVTVSITMAVKGGLFKYAGKATKETQNAITAEQMLAEGKIQIGDFFYDSYDDYLNGIYSENQPDAPIQLTYTLSNSEPTGRAVSIYLNVKKKDDINFREYAEPILNKLETDINDEDDLIEEKMRLILEGINYWKDEWYDGETFNTIDDYIDYCNENWDTSYNDIYDYIDDQWGYGGTDSEKLNNLLIDENWLKPEPYMKEYGKIIITKPDKETEEIWWGEGNITYQVTKNGNYTFTAENGNEDKGAITVKVTNIIEERFSNIYKETTEYKENGKTVAWIPKGFAVGIESDNIVINKVSEGLVITDKVDNEGHSIGNEFVWIPVEEGKFNRTSWSNNEPTETIDGNYTEEVPQDLIDSVETYGGFYIGRYEAGSTEKRTSSSGVTTMVVQKGAYPYNFITWTDAVDRSEEMYEESDSVVSTLCYGTQWDSALRFIKDKFNVSNSTSWGNYYNTEDFSFEGEYYTYDLWKNDSTTKANGEGKLLQTGASQRNRAKNIYDLAGNAYEWTMENYVSSGRVHRGGIFGGDGGIFPAADRVNYDPSYSYNFLGFRVSLYVK